MPDPAITVPPPGDRPAEAGDTSSILGSADLNPDVSPPSGVNVTPSAPAASDVAPATAPTPRVPMNWQPRYRSGIGGLVDEMRDAIAGSPGHQVYTDESGQKYVGASPDTNRSKWMRVAANLAQGAARGYAAGQGPGGQGRAVMAGFQGAQQQQDRQRQQQKELTAEARQENQDKFNNAKQQLDLATSTLNLQRLKAESSREEVEFSQKQIAWHKEQGDVELGVIPDWQHPAAVQQADPDFFKHLYKDGTISGVPLVNDNGRGGIDVFLKVQNPKNTIIPAGHEIARYNPPKKPGDKPTITYEKTTGPMSAADFEAQNNDANQKWHEFVKQDQGEKLQAAQLDDIKSQQKLRAAQTQEALSVAAKNNMEARKLQIENQAENVITDQTSAKDLGQMLVDGRAAPSLIKNRKNYQQALAWADVLSRQQTGQRFDTSLSETLYESYKKGMQRYLSGDKADNIASFDKFFGHAANASNLIQKLRNSDWRLVNEPLNKLSKYMNGPHSNDIAAMQQALEVARSEWQAFTISNKAPTDQDRKVGLLLASEDAKPSDLGAALNEWAKTAQTRMRADDFEFYRLTRGQSHIPMLMSNETQQAMRDFGLDPNKTYASGPPAQQMVGVGPNITPTGGGPAAAPTAAPTGGPPPPATNRVVPAGATPGRNAKGEIIGYRTADGKEVKF